MPDKAGDAVAFQPDKARDAVAVEPSKAGDAVSWDQTGDGVAVVTMALPRANALGPRLIEGLDSALTAVDARVVVVASALDGFFAAGADIKHMSTIDAAAFAAYGAALRAVLDRLAAPDRITIAAVEGLALGGGLELAMACTLRVAGGQARFGLPEVRIGLIPGAGGTQRLPRLVGRGRALDIMLTGRQVPAAQAHAMGLVDRLVPAGEARTAALDLAKDLRAASTPALAAVVRSVDAAFELPLEQGLAYEAAQEQRLFEGGDAHEGIRAFLEKRPPTFA